MSIYKFIVTLTNVNNIGGAFAFLLLNYLLLLFILITIIAVKNLYYNKTYSNYLNFLLSSAISIFIKSFYVYWVVTYSPINTVYLITIYIIFYICLCVFFSIKILINIKNYKDSRNKDESFINLMNLLGVFSLYNLVMSLISYIAHKYVKLEFILNYENLPIICALFLILLLTLFIVMLIYFCLLNIWYEGYFEEVILWWFLLIVSVAVFIILSKLYLEWILENTQINRWYLIIVYALLYLLLLFYCVYKLAHKLTPWRSIRLILNAKWGLFITFLACYLLLSLQLFYILLILI